MKRSSKILLKLTTKKFLYYLASLPAAAFVIFDRKRNYEKSLKEFDDWREANQQSFKNLLYRLSKARLIEKYQKQNQHLIRLTSKGKKKIIHYLTRELKIKQTSKWDKKWRIVIFDIPEKKKTARDVLRSKLKRLGFKKLQKSVFIYPHDCEKEINFLRMNYGIERHVIYLLVNKIDHEEKLIKSFHKAKILK